MTDSPAARRDPPEGTGRTTRVRPDLTVLRDDVRAMRAYHVEPSEGMVKLDAMENPYVLPPAIARDLGRRLERVALNRYPPVNPQAFKRRLADGTGLSQGAGLMLGNGSDELIHLIIQACARPRATVLSPWPSFVRYETSTLLNGCRFVGVPLTPDFALDRPAMLEAIRTHHPALIFIAWPNNPTGNLFDRGAVAEILDTAPGLVVLDEAYLPYAQNTWLPDLSSRPNLLILRTLSKLGLAGIRLGYVCGDPAWIAELEKARPPYNVNALTLAAADLLLEHLELFERQASVLRSERDALLAALRLLPGVVAFDSSANFVLFRVGSPQSVFEGLKRRGILVADVSRMHPLLSGCLRATVGLPEENRALVAALAEILGSDRSGQLHSEG